MRKDAKIYVAGHRGLVGSAIVRRLQKGGYTNLVFRSHAELDLKDGPAVDAFFTSEKPAYVFLAAAKVGGIMANNIYRADFIYDNIQIQNNVIYHSYKSGVKKLVFLGSSCIYPKDAPQPLKEEYLLTSELEYTNEPYAIAKIAGIKMCESFNLQYDTNFISLMPTNLFGPNDNFDLEKSHVLPAVIRKLHLGKCLQTNDMKSLREDFNRYPVEGVNGSAEEKDILDKLKKYGIRQEGQDVFVRFWGTGKPRREFLHSDDLADACLYIFENLDFTDLIQDKSLFDRTVKNIRNTHINIGTGTDVTIRELVEIVTKITGYGGKIDWDRSKPDGTSQKLMDVSKLHSLGWHEKLSLEQGIRQVYEIYAG
ncbi:MAG TPA: GDP-L-fucose synthase [Bacteroidales bacterium]|nr:GDP-L-fucose synthase [Bacteroidales bacterium]